MTTIKFERFSRECQYNEEIRSGKSASPLIYDFKVLIDGEHRATITTSGGHGGERWCLNDAEGRAIHGEKGPRYPNRRIGFGISKKSDFETIILYMLAADKIPTIARMAELRAEEAAAELKLQADAEQAVRDHRAKACGVELLAALKEAIKFGGGWPESVFTQCRRAICAAENVEHFDVAVDQMKHQLRSYK